MASAVCSKCGGEYRWHGYRGSRLEDNPSPCCDAKGKANHDSPITLKSVKRCPDCGKCGLWWAKAMRDSTLPRQPMELVDYGGYKVSVYTAANMYCPRCQKWVIPVKQVVKPTMDESGFTSGAGMEK